MPYDEEGYFWLDKPLKEGDEIPRVPLGLPFQPKTVSEYKALMRMNARVQNVMTGPFICAGTSKTLEGVSKFAWVQKFPISGWLKYLALFGLAPWIVTDVTTIPANDIFIGYNVESGGSWDPVVLDLHGNGIQTINVGQGPFVDIEGNGFAEAIGWVSPDAGILFMDRNGNGVIDNGSELFGGHTPLPNGQLAVDGYQALAALDGNQDGKIDSQDPEYSQLRVWVDSDTDGVSQSGELFDLPQLGITSIDLNWTTVNTTDAQGNIEITAGSFQKTDGSTGLIADYGFQVRPTMVGICPEN